MTQAPCCHPLRMRIDPRVVQRARLVLTLGLVALAAAVYGGMPVARAEVNHAASMLMRGDVTALRDYILSFGVWAPVVSALLMVLQALVAPLPAFLLAFANGLAFGLFWGSLLTFASATLAAGISFGLARALGRGVVEALVGHTGLALTDRWFARWGVWAILFARLMPIMSFDVISYAAGLTGMRFRSFLAATMLGILPATLLFAYLGEHAPQSVTLLFIAFGGAVVVAAGVALIRVRRRRIVLLRKHR